MKDQGRVDNLLGVYEDISNPVFGLLFHENFETEKAVAIGKIKRKLDLVQKFYGDKNFALGYITLVDFMFAEFSY